MKHIYSLILLISPFIAFSQSVISNVQPNIGDEFVINQEEVAPEPGPSGADLTWDFSDQTIEEYSVEYTVMLPSEVEGSVDFPDATMVWVGDIGVAVLNSFMSFDNNTFSNYGTLSSGSGFSGGVAYTDPIEQFTYPFEYQDTGSDEYSGAAFGLTGDNEIEGTHSYIVDGYGTVITPFGTYTNVLRITATDSETITVLGTEVLTNRVETSWYSPNYPIPVMVILTDESFTGGTLTESTETMSALASYTPSTTGLTDRENQNAFSIYPNPASDYITVDFDNAKANTALNIYSATGKLVDTKNGVQSNQKVDVSRLSPGIYIAVLSVDGQQYAQSPFSRVD